MGYLSENFPGKSWIDCPDAYPYAMIVEYTLRDPFMYPKPDDALALVIKDRLPDVEEWQASVIRVGRVKFRFHKEPDRAAAKDALLTNVGFEIFVTGISYQNPPDRVEQGEVEQ